MNPLPNGTRVGPYEIVATLGAGGMGEVYRARDPRLGRDVAIKILPEHFTADADRVARFQREAQVLASLNHPNIAVIHDVQQSAGISALVLELVEGPTLADRVAQGPMPVEEVLAVAKQIAEALEAAHEQGIIHRDLKPANVKLRIDGTVKVLDFGLAKTADTASPTTSLSMSPTLTSPATQVGVILGTAAYMSPEQAKGKPADRRGDVWAFGCVVYEMLTGTRPFDGEDVADVFAAVLRAEPDWNKLPADTPAAIHKLLRRCLTKDRKERLSDFGSARLEIKDALAAPAPSQISSEVRASLDHTKRSAGAMVAWVIAAIAVLAAFGTAVYLRPPKPDTRVFRATLLPPEDMTWASITPATRFALSPDGTRLAMVARKGNRTQLFVRSLDSMTAQPLTGTEGVSVAFWSPDSKFIAYCANGKLKKIEASGGAAIDLADMDNNNGGSWGKNDVIVYRPSNQNSLYQVSAAGGTPSPATTSDDKNAGGVHWQPFFLPDGKHFLFHAVAGSGAVYIGSLDQKEKSRQLIAGGSNAQYSAGYVLFMRESNLMAQRFDMDKLELTGEARPVVDHVVVGGDSGRTGAFSVSQSGVLVYQAGSNVDIPGGMHLMWYDRAGKTSDTINQTGDNRQPRLSPDNKQVAVSRRTPNNTDIWIIDLLRGANTRLTSASGIEADPVWSPDGTRIFYRAADPSGNGAIYSKATNGTGDEQVVLKFDQSVTAVNDLSFDGKYILFKADRDIWFVPTSGDKTPQRFMKTPFEEAGPQFSPDGKWIAYYSDETGRQFPQVYVQPFPPTPTGQRVPISVNGGGVPHWSATGKEIFFFVLKGNMPPVFGSVDLKFTGSTLEAGPVKELFPLPPGTNDFAVASDGKRFVFPMRAETPTQNTTVEPITALLNWTASLKN
jgi:serine/threonine protein kinase/Tol biopolymer transport system component